MPYAPGVTDRSGEIRAQGMLQGGMGLLRGVEQGVEIWKKNKEEEKQLQGAIKATESLIQAMGPIASQISPEFDKALKDLSVKVTDPALSTRERASLSQNALKGIGDLMGTGIQLKQMQAQEAQRKAVAEAQIAADRARQQKEAFAQTVDELVGLGAANNGQLDPRIMQQVGPAAYGAAQMQLQKVYGKGSGAQTFQTLQEAQAAAQALKAPGGTVPTIKFENNAYVVETGIQAPKTLPDPEEDLRWKQFGKTIEADVASGDNARKLLPAVNRVSALFEKGTVDTGFGTKVTNEMRSIGKAIGIPIDESKLKDTQEAEAYTGRFFLEYIQQTKGSISEKENAIFQSLGPELSKDTAVNKNLIKMVKDRLDLDQKVARLADGWRAKRISREQYEEERQKLLDKYDQRIDSLFPDGTANPMPPLDKAQQYFK